MEFVKIMSSGGGRLTRAIAGVVLIGIGIALGGGWLVLSVIGLVPLFAGIANVCLLAPLMGQPFKAR